MPPEPALSPTRPTHGPALTLVSPQLPAAIASSVWRGTELGSTVTESVQTGWPTFDRELPGGGWPRGSLTEILCPQPSLLEWRLTGASLRHIVAQGSQIVVVGPPKHPHLPGLLHEGFDERHIIWIQAEAPAERLWVTEQLIRSNSAGAILAWMPQARQEQIRRLQIGAQTCNGLVFLFRPESAQHEASAAPLRLHVSYGLDWELNVNIFKRRGPVHDKTLRIPSVPGGLQSILTPRLRQPSRFLNQSEAADVVGSPAPRRTVPRRLASQH